MARRRKTFYKLLHQVELARQRQKRIFGNAMEARALPQQETETGIGASARGRMTKPCLPVSVKIEQNSGTRGSFDQILVYLTIPFQYVLWSSFAFLFQETKRRLQIA
jgi:hypothetical protein